MGRAAGRALRSRNSPATIGALPARR